jgi:predicted O-methyltransferase YrrM
MKVFEIEPFKFSENYLRGYFKVDFFNRFLRNNDLLKKNIIIVSNYKDDFNNWCNFKVITLTDYFSLKIKENNKTYIFDKDLKNELSNDLLFLDINFLKNINKIEIQGFFSKENQESLRRLVRDKIKNIKNPMILEIGSWKGLSTSIIAKEIKDKGRGRLFCLDAWETIFQNSETAIALQKELDTKNVMDIFKRNLKLLELNNYISIFNGYSNDFKDVISDNFFDIIFIDGEHAYSGVINDLKNYLPKLKKDGLIIGDDCEVFSNMIDKDFIENNKDFDYVLLKNGMDVHCGVVKALKETFNDEFRIDFQSSVWFKDFGNEKRYSDKKCPICNSNVLYKGYYECPSCSFYFSNNLRNDLVNNELILNNQSWLEARIEKIESLAILEKGKTLFEIGCAKGELLNFYKNKGLNVCGCDISFSSENIELNIVAKDVREYEFINNFDYIFAFHVFEYIPNIKEHVLFLYEKLNLNGKLIFQVGLNNEINEINQDHHNYFTNRALLELLKSFKNVKIEYEISRDSYRKIFRSAIICIINDLN